MEKILNNIRDKYNFSIGCLLQLVASLSWVASIIVYGSFNLGDYLQLLASSAWTISNIINYLKRL